MEPILVVTDCTGAGCDACDQAVALARETGAPLLAVAVAHVTYPTVGYSVVGYSNVAALLEKVREERACAALEEVKAAAGAAGLERVTVRTAGPEASAIRALAVESGASMIVVPAESRVTEQLLRDAPCPVLVVRGERHARTAA